MNGPVLRVVHGKNTYEVEDWLDNGETGCPVLDNLFGDWLSNVFVIAEAFSEIAVKAFVEYLRTGISSVEQCFEDLSVRDKLTLTKLLYSVGAVEAVKRHKAHILSLNAVDVIDAIIELQFDEFHEFISDEELLSCITSSEITDELVSKIVLLPWPWIYSNFAAIMHGLSIELRRLFVLKCVLQHGVAAWICPFIHLVHLSDASLIEVRNLMMKNSAFAVTAITDLLKVRADKNRIKKEMEKAVYALVEKNAFGVGNFYAARVLFEDFGSFDNGYREKGFNLIKKASVKKIPEAQAYLLDYHIKRGEIAEAISYCQVLMSDDRRDYLDKTIIKIFSSPDHRIHLNAKMFEELLRIGYISTMDNDLRIRLIKWYIESMDGDISVVSEFIPLDYNNIGSVEFFFRKVVSSKCFNPSVLFFHGYAYLCGICCEKSVVKAIQFFTAAAAKKNQRAMQVLSQISSITFRMAICGSSGVGKTQLIDYISDEGGMCAYKRSGYEYKLILEECDSLENITNADCAAICYDPSEEDLDCVIRHYNTIRDRISQICVVHTKCDQKVDGLRCSEVIDWCQENKIFYVMASTLNSFNIRSIIDPLVDVALNTVSIEQLSVV